MHKQCISGVFITLLFAMVAPSYAVDNSMVPKELEDAMKSCRDSAQGSVESFDSCMEQKGFDEKPQSSVPATTMMTLTTGHPRRPITPIDELHKMP